MTWTICINTHIYFPHISSPSIWSPLETSFSQSMKSNKVRWTWIDMTHCVTVQCSIVISNTSISAIISNTNKIDKWLLCHAHFLGLFCNKVTRILKRAITKTTTIITFIHVSSNLHSKCLCIVIVRIQCPCRWMPRFESRKPNQVEEAYRTNPQADLAALHDERRWEVKKR